MGSCCCLHLYIAWSFQVPLIERNLPQRQACLDKRCEISWAMARVMISYDSPVQIQHGCWTKRVSDFRKTLAECLPPRLSQRILAWVGLQMTASKAKQEDGWKDPKWLAHVFCTSRRSSVEDLWVIHEPSSSMSFDLSLTALSSVSAILMRMRSSVTAGSLLWVPSLTCTAMLCLTASLSWPC